MEHVDANGAGNALAPREIRLTLDEAIQVVVRKRKLGTFSADGLRQVGQSASDQIEQQGWSERLLQAIVTACHMILEAREQGTLEEPKKKEKPAREPEEVFAEIEGEDDLPF